MKSIYEQMGGTYKQCGDYLIPEFNNFRGKIHHRKYGRARERYLKSIEDVITAIFYQQEICPNICMKSMFRHGKF